MPQSIYFTVFLKLLKENKPTHAAMKFNGFIINSKRMPAYMPPTLFRDSFLTE